MSRYARYVFLIVQVYTLVAYILWYTTTSSGTDFVALAETEFAAAAVSPLGSTADSSNSFIVSTATTESITALKQQHQSIEDEKLTVEHSFRARVEAEKLKLKQLQESQKRTRDIIETQLKQYKTKHQEDMEKLKIEMEHLRNNNRQLAEELRLESAALQPHVDAKHQTLIKQLLHRNEANIKLVVDKKVAPADDQNSNDNNNDESANTNNNDNNNNASQNDSSETAWGPYNDNISMHTYTHTLI